MEKILPRRIKFIIFGGLLFFLSVGWIMLLYPAKESVPAVDEKNYFRLHILANSNTAEDQALKLEIKEAVVNYLTPFVKDAGNIMNAREIIISRRDDILRVAGEIIASKGRYDAISMEIGNFDFPVKSYGALVLPEGNYQAVRLIIGEGAGENWWCVLFPPLCFIDGYPSAKKDSPEQKDEPEIKIRWKIVEFFKN